MAKYNLLLGIDTGFEFIHTTLGVIFEDMSKMDEAAMIRHYCVGFLIVSLNQIATMECFMQARRLVIRHYH